MTKPLLIAEISSNHNMQLSRALDLIAAVADAGATHAKFQAWQADLYYSRHHPALHARARAGQIPEAWWHTLAMHCQRKDVGFLCTAFDTASLDIIAPYADNYKVASGDLTNVPLLRIVAAKHKPVILSTGAATVPEIEEAVSVLSLGGAASVTLLHCVSAYPTPVDQANLSAITSLAQHFDALDVGYSDHTANLWCCLAAYSLGARTIEAHFDLDDGKGAETGHSLKQRDFTALVDAIQASTFLPVSGCVPYLTEGHWQWLWPDVWHEVFHSVIPALGSGVKYPMPCEVAERDWARRGLYAARAVKRGEPLADALVPLRPACGVEGMARPLAAREWDRATAGKAAQDLEAGVPVSEGDIA